MIKPFKLTLLIEWDPTRKDDIMYVAVVTNILTSKHTHWKFYIPYEFFDDPENITFQEYKLAHRFCLDAPLFVKQKIYDLTEKQYNKLAKNKKISFTLYH